MSELEHLKHRLDRMREYGFVDFDDVLNLFTDVYDVLLKHESTTLSSPAQGKGEEE